MPHDGLGHVVERQVFVRAAADQHNRCVETAKRRDRRLWRGRGRVVDVAYTVKLANQLEAMRDASEGTDRITDMLCLYAKRFRQRCCGGDVHSIMPAWQSDIFDCTNLLMQRTRAPP